LWSLPELDELAGLNEWQQQKLSVSIEVANSFENLIKHSFTHFDLKISVAQIQVQAETLREMPHGILENEELCWVGSAELCRMGLPSPVQKILRRHGFDTVSAA
jgi:adenine-specific DNA glycosylase